MQIYVNNAFWKCGVQRCSVQLTVYKRIVKPNLDLSNTWCESATKRTEAQTVFKRRPTVEVHGNTPTHLGTIHQQKDLEENDIFI